MKFSKTSLLLTVAASLALAGCGERRSQNAEESGVEPDRYAEFTTKTGNPTFLVDSIEAKGASLDTKWGRAKTKVYNFKACLKDPILRSPIERTKFAVGDGETSRSLRTDDSGCLLWSESINVQLMKPEMLFEMTRSFTAQETYAGSISITFAFNPWDDGNAAIDMRKDTPPVKPQKAGWQHPASWSPYISPSSIAFTFAGEDRERTKITNLLSLEIAHHYEVRFSPALMTRNLIGQWTGHDLTEGRVKLRLFFVKANAKTITKDDIISSFEHTFTILEDKSAFARISLPIYNVADASSRMKAIAEITPIDDEVNGIQTAYFEGLVAPLTSSNFTVEFNPNPRTDTRIQSIVAGLDAPSMQPQAATLNGLDIMQKYSGLKQSSAPEMKSVLDRVLASKNLDLSGLSKSSIFEMCDMVYTPEVIAQLPRQEYCKSGWFSSAVESDFNISSEEIVVKVTTGARQIGSTVEAELRISNSFEYAAGNTQSASTGAEAKASAGWSLGLFTKILKKVTFGVITVNVGADTYVSTSTTASTSRSHNQSGSVTTGESVKAIGNTYEFGVDYKRCLLLSMSGKNQAVLRAKNATIPAGVYYCSDKVETKTARETFFFVNQTISASPFTDPNSAESTKWRMMVRGKRELEMFKQIAASKDIVLNFTRYTENFQNGVLPKEFLTTQKYPGVLSGE